MCSASRLQPEHFSVGAQLYGLYFAEVRPDVLWMIFIRGPPDLNRLEAWKE